MKMILRLTAAAAAIMIQIALSILPVVNLLNKSAFLNILRIALIVLLWGGIVYLLFLVFKSLYMEKDRNYEKALEVSIDSFLNNLIKISSGNLVTEIPDTALFKNNYTGSRRVESKAGKSIDQSIEELNAITATPLKRISFNGANNYNEGLLMGGQVAKYMNRGESLLIIIPFFSQVLHSLRAKGCISYLQQNKKEVRILPIATGKGNKSLTINIAKEKVERDKSISAIYTTDGISTNGIEKWLRENGLDNKISLFTHNLTAENVSMLERNSLKCLLAENFYTQAYNGIINLYNALEAHWRPISYKIYMDPLIIDKNNYNQHWDAQKKETLLSEAEMANLTTPEKMKSGRKWHISVIMPTLESFFVMAAKGALEAKERLESMGVTVDVIEAFDDWEHFASRQTMEPYIRKAMSNNADGISTVVFDRNLVPVINEAVDKGLLVTIFNSEPLNLREIILNVSDNINILQKNSTSMAASAEESARANKQIIKGMNNIEEGTSVQNSQLIDTEKSLHSLNEVIQKISGIVQKYTQSVEQMNSEAEKGVDQVSETMQSFHELGTSFKKTDEQLNVLQTEMNRIRKIVSTIDTFSTDTNVLAINASIQAARAGEQGKTFAVVAKEIRSLSEKSSQATEEIGRIIDEILRGVTGVVSHSNENLKLVEINNSRFADVNKAFQVISNHVKQSIESIRGINTSIASAVDSSSSIKDAMNSLSSGNNTTLQSIQEISVSLRELSQQSAELSDMAARYLKLANTQEQVISQLSF